MAGDVPWICRDGHHSFKLRRMVHDSAIEDHRKVECPRCGSMDTGPAKTTGYKNESLGKVVAGGRMLESPSLAQLAYIKALGGDPYSVRNKGDAGDLISRLKKEQGK